MKLAGRHGRMAPEESGAVARAIAWATAALLVLPMVVVIALAVNGSQYVQFQLPPDDVSLKWLREVADSPLWRSALLQSVKVALLSAVLATALGTACALGIRNSRYAGVVQTLMLLPLIVPLIVTALAIYPLWVDLGLLGTTAGLVIGHTVVAMPFAFLTVWSSVGTLDRELEKAAASLGAGSWQVLRRVTLPLIAPALMASVIVAAAMSFDEIIVSLFIASPQTQTMPVVLWSHLRENLDPTVAAASVFMAAVNLVILFVGMGVGRWAVRRRGAAT
jgi:putative spermidine/putrescine transport system permease protein